MAEPSPRPTATVGAGATPDVHRRRIIRTLAAVVVVVGLIAGGPWVYARLLAPQPADPLMLTAPVTEPTGEPVDGPLDVDGTWRVSEGSQAGYRLHEVLSGQPVTVVGRTTAVNGTLTVAGSVLTDAEITVDVASVSTDESARDAYFRRALDTTTHPVATFTLTEPVDVSGLGSSDRPVSVAANGTLTLHGVSRPVTVALEARWVPGGIEVAGTVPITLADHGLPAPDLRFVTVEPAGTVEMLLTLTR